MKAVNKFKGLLYKKHPERAGDLFGGHKQLFQPPAQMHESDFEAKNVPQRTKSMRRDHFSTIESTKSFPDEHEHESDVVTSEPIQITTEPDQTTSPNAPDTASNPHDANNTNTNDDNPSRTSPPTFTTTTTSPTTSPTTTSPLPIPSPASGKGQAHDPLHEAPLYLRVGSGHADHPDSDSDSIAQSPAAAEFNIYDTAYRQEVARIKGVSESTLVYLNRRVGAWSPPHGAGGRAAPGGADDHGAVTSNPAPAAADPDAGADGATDDATDDAKSPTAPPSANQGSGETHEA